MRVAALYDVHGNLPALDAVLRELAYERVDRIVFGGDLAAGPFPRETLELAGNLPNALFVRGNADRWMVELSEGTREPQGLVDEWAVTQLGPEHLDFMRSFEPTVELDGVLYCHATPHDDMPIFTERSPEERVRELIGEVAVATVVVGHTHMQFDRTVGDVRVVNSGSVGLAYGTLNACWTVVEDGEPQHRETPYDRGELMESAYDKVEAFLEPATREEAIDYFEAQAAG